MTEGRRAARGLWVWGVGTANRAPPAPFPRTKGPPRFFFELLESRASELDDEGLPLKMVYDRPQAFTAR